MFIISHILSIRLIHLVKQFFLYFSIEIQPVCSGINGKSAAFVCQLLQLKIILANAVMILDEGEAWVEVKALGEGAPVLGWHLPVVAQWKGFKLRHDLCLQKKLNISTISSHCMTFTLRP